VSRRDDEEKAKGLALYQGRFDPRLPTTESWIAHRSQLWVGSTPAPERCVLISITHPGHDAYVPDGYVDVLRLQFEDYGSPKTAPEGAVLFDRAQAAEIAAFARRYRGRNILVHCVAGISRSGAVVEVLLQTFPEYEDAGHEEAGLPRSANPHVRALLEEAIERKKIKS